MNITEGLYVRHKKRDHTYMVQGRSKLQIGPETMEKMLEGIALGMVPAHDLAKLLSERLEKLSLVTYFHIEDDSIWNRPEGEFVDGRFEEIEDTRLYDPTSHEESPPCTVPDPEDAQ